MSTASQDRPAGDRGSAPAAASGADVLAVADLEVRYGRIVAVHGVSVTVAAGQVVALLGPNGAGKTSLLSAVAGVVGTAAGSVHLEGADITGQPAHRLAARGLRMVPETRALFPDMTIADNLAVGARGGRLTPDDLDRMVAIFPVLGDRRQQLAGLLSGGEQQQLAIARALVGNPRVLMLDEPSMGLAPRIVAGIMTTLRGLTGAGLSVLLAEQNAHAVLGSVDHAVVMERGRVVAAGPPEEIRSTLAEGYLGGGARAARGAGPGEVG